MPKKNHWLKWLKPNLVRAQVYWCSTSGNVIALLSLPSSGFQQCSWISHLWWHFPYFPLTHPPPVLGNKPRALSILDKHSAIEWHPQPLSQLAFLTDLSTNVFIMETPRRVQAYPKSETLVEGRLAPYFYLRACEENQQWFSIAHLRISLITYSHMKVTIHWEGRICCEGTEKVAPWVGEGACFQAQWPECDLQDPRGGRRELTPGLHTYAWSHVCTHTYATLEIYK